MGRGVPNARAATLWLAVSALWMMEAAQAGRLREFVSNAKKDMFWSTISASSLMTTAFHLHLQEFVRAVTPLTS